MIITHRLYYPYIIPTFFFLLNINIQFRRISRLMHCDLRRRSRGKKRTRKYEGDYDDDSVVVVFRLLGDDDSTDDDDDDEKEEWRRCRQECVRGGKKIGMFGDRSIGHALMKQNDRKRGWWPRQCYGEKKRARMVLMYYTIYIYTYYILQLVCVVVAAVDGRVYTSSGNLIRVWHFRQIGGNLKVPPVPRIFFPLVVLPFITVVPLS